MRTAWWAGLLLAAPLLACSGRQPPPRPSPAAGGDDPARPLPSPLPEVAARVNGQDVPLRSVAIAAREAAAEGTLGDAQKRVALRTAMDKLIVRELLFQEATRRGLGPDERALEQAYDRARLPYKDDQSWALFLSKDGLDPQSYRQELRVRFTVQALISQEQAKLPEPSDKEARAFFDDHPDLFESGERLRVSHIMLRVPRGATPAQRAAARAAIENLLARIGKGEDFAALARRDSQDPSSAPNGGRLEPFGRGAMAGPFEQAAYALKPGQVSGVVELQDSLHLIKLLERLPSEKVSFETARQEIKQKLLHDRWQAAFSRLVATLKAGARIETYL